MNDDKRILAAAGRLTRIVFSLLERNYNSFSLEQRYNKAANQRRGASVSRTQGWARQHWEVALAYALALRSPFSLAVWLRTNALSTNAFLVQCFRSGRIHHLALHHGHTLADHPRACHTGAVNGLVVRRRQ